MLIATLSKSWAIDHQLNQLHFGPRGSEVCPFGKCEAPGWRDPMPSDIEAFQVLALIGGVVAAATMCAIAALAIRRGRDRVATRLGWVVLGFAAVTMAYLEVRLLRFGLNANGDNDLHVGWAAWLEFAGLTLAVLVLARMRRTISDPTPAAELPVAIARDA